VVVLNKILVLLSTVTEKENLFSLTIVFALVSVNKITPLATMSDFARKLCQKYVTIKRSYDLSTSVMRLW